MCPPESCIDDDVLLCDDEGKAMFDAAAFVGDAAQELSGVLELTERGVLEDEPAVVLCGSWCERGADHL
jgi:hypothetical protein